MKKLSIALVTFLPVLAVAASTNTTTTPVGLAGLLQKILDLFSTLNIVFLSAAVLMFFYGLVKFILNSGDKDKIKGAKSMMTWSIIALFLMVSVWGIVSLIQKTIWGTDTSGLDAPSLPALPKVKQ